MSNIQKVPVFSTYKPFLHILTIYDWKNFHNQDRRILKRNICLAIVVSILALAFIVAMVCDAWFCVTNNFNVVEIGSAFGILINAVQFAITYNSIRMKSDLVNQLIAGMNKIINERKWMWRIEWNWSKNVLFVSWLILRIQGVPFHQGELNTMKNWRNALHGLQQLESTFPFGSLCHFLLSLLRFPFCMQSSDFHNPIAGLQCFSFSKSAELNWPDYQGLLMLHASVLAPRNGPYEENYCFLLIFANFCQFLLIFFNFC